MEIQAVRRRILQQLVTDRAGGNKAEFCRLYPGIDANYLSQLLGEHRSIGEKSAANLEEKIGLPKGYLDDIGNAHLDESEARQTLEAPDLATVRMHRRKADLDPESYGFVGVYDARLSAGNGVSNVTWVERPEDDQLSFRQAWFRKKGLVPSNCKALYVRGHSMVPELKNQDTVIIDTADTEIIDGEIYAAVYKDQFYIKTIERIGGGYLLRSINPEFNNIEITGDDIANLKILGRKVWRAG